MPFDADAYVEALEKPSITIGGETHEGRVPSFNQLITFAARYDDMAGEDVPVDEVREIARGVFSLSYDDEVVDEILDLPIGAVNGALEDFLASQMDQNGQGPETEEATTD